LKLAEYRSNKIPLGIIIPVYNEAENIGETLTAIEEKVTIPHRIHIVYDFDKDNTLPVAHEFLRKGLDLKFIKNPQRGVVNAIKIGLKKAEEDYLLVTMADLSDDYSVVDTMCQLMSEGYDVVCGSRYMKGGKQIGGPLLKKTISRMAGISLKYITGLPTHDATNSFKLYRKRMLNSMNIESDGGFEIGIEIVVKAHFSGYRVIEIPSIWTDRQQGKSRFKILKWAPKYLKWYFNAISKRLNQLMLIKKNAKV
jgi:glycosyltransferase involved in cell wall biosynthesis